MFKNLDLLSARSLILAAAAILLLSVLGMCVSMLRPHDSGGLARDSYGTRGAGYRGLFEVLDAIGVSVARELAPPRPGEDTRHTLLLLNPNPRLIEVGPKYVMALRSWIERGGHVVVTPSTSRGYFWSSTTRKPEDAKGDILRALEVDDLIAVGEMSEQYAEENYTEEDYTWQSGADRESRSAPRRKPSTVQRWTGLREQLVPPKSLAASLDGSLASLAEQVKALAVPGEGFLTLNAEPDELAGSMKLTGADGKEHLVVAVVRHGAGEIVVLSEPDLLSNRLIAEADNSVLAAHLIAPRGEAVVFDEFYHGLAVRGNPLYLLTRAGFAATTVGLLLLVGAGAWRSAVFLGPPLEAAKRTRRDIGEYVSAMAQFFSRGRGGRRFLAGEVRDGVLRQVCHELKLPMDTLDLDVIVQALARRDRERARRLEEAVQEVNATLAGGGKFPRTRFVPMMQRLASCL